MYLFLPMRPLLSGSFEKSRLDLIFDGGDRTDKIFRVAYACVHGQQLPPCAPPKNAGRATPTGHSAGFLGFGTIGKSRFALPREDALQALDRPRGVPIGAPALTISCAIPI